MKWKSILEHHLLICIVSLAPRDLQGENTRKERQKALGASKSSLQPHGESQDIRMSRARLLHVDLSEHN